MLCSFALAATGPASTPADTIGKLRDALETVEKREEHLNRKVDNEIKQAKAFSQQNKKREAIQCLKRKKMYEAEIEKINGARLTLEQQMIAIEATVTNAETVNAMKSGAKAMQAARQNVDADTVGDLMDDIKEEMEVADEISAAISAPANDVLNDDDLLNELNEMEELELESQLLDAPPIPAMPLPAAPTAAFDLPAAPTALPPAPAAEDADMKALRELEAAMAM